MRKRLGNILKIAVITAILFILTGCFAKSAEELYGLPQLSEEYVNLQEKIDEILNKGAVYSAPISGNYRAVVQLEDLNNDGIDEAITFFRVSGDNKPLKIYIFEKEDNRYYQAAVIEGEGTNIESISYVDLDGEGTDEIVVGWQIDSGINILSAYSIRDFQVSPLFSTDYTEYVAVNFSNISNNRSSDILVIRMSTSELSGNAELFTLTAEGEVVSSSAQLSSGIESISRIRIGKLIGSSMAAYIESEISGGIITDIITSVLGGLKNITMNEETRASTDTMRSYSEYCRDVDNDGIIEVPRPVMLKSQGDSALYWIVEWYQYGPSGRCNLIMTTYSNTTDSWYLKLPQDWSGKISVRRDDSVSGERAMIFSTVNGENIEDFLAIYTLSGKDKEKKAEMGSRFMLRIGNEVIYAAEILKNPNECQVAISRELIRENFNILYSEWKTGKT